jgi:hypothetical protein
MRVLYNVLSNISSIISDQLQILSSSYLFLCFDINGHEPIPSKEDV